jgi:hypothetical protein
MKLTIERLIEILKTVNNKYYGEFNNYCKDVCRIEKIEFLHQSGKISSDSFVNTISSNVDNEKISDSEFRKFIKNTLTIVSIEN